MSTPITKRVRLRRGIALTTALALSAGASVLGAAAASAAPAQPSIDTSGFDSGRYIVVLQDDAMATYRGGLPNLQRTAPVGTRSLDADSPAASAYATHLESTQTEVASSVGADIATNLTVTMNGFIADLSAEQALELARDGRVSQIFPDERLQITQSPANDFLELEALWGQVGGQEEAGAGVVVGVLDTGIAPENPLFAGEPLGTAPGDEPYRDGDTIRFQKGDGQTFTGFCETGAQFTADDCSTKIVGARYFIDGFLAGGEPLGSETQVPGEYVSPRDGDGHGSHTASTAAGNADVPVQSAGGADLGTMHGVAPAARIAAYKVCWSGPDPSSTEDDGCYTSDTLAAIEQATTDGVDVINYSIGGGAATSVATATDIAFLNAAAAGVFVSASAGNSGPGASTLDHAAPWYTTVAAATVPNYEATIVLPGDVRIPGASITVPMDDADGITGPFVYAGDIAAAGENPARAALCLPDTLDEALATGMIVLCDRGENARAEKSEVVADAGGIASVLVNVSPNTTDLDDHAIPTVHADAQYRDDLLAAARADVEITLLAGNSSGIETPAPIVAGFSSRGPALADGSDVIKPDIAAPGVSIIAAGPNPADGEPTFAMLSGTSMAAPHVAGLAAIYLGERPLATPAEVKSALMTTATNTVNADASESVDPWAQGAGFVNTQSMLDPGLIYQNGTPDWFGYLRGLGYGLSDGWVGSAIDPSDLNIASIAVGALAGTQTVTRTVTALEPGSYTVSTSGVPGVDVSVAPQTLEFTEAGQSLSYRVTFDVATAPLMTWSTGFLTWTSSEHTVRSPLAVQPVAVAAPQWVEGTGTVGETPVSIVSGIDGPIPLSANGLVPFTRLGAETLDQDEVAVMPFSIPAGELVHYVTLDVADNTADFDLYVQRLNAAGAAVEQWDGATEAADEEVLLESPAAGNYRVLVVAFNTRGAGPIEAVVDHVGVGTGQQEGSFRTEPATVAGERGEPASYTAKWNGLDTNAEYLGVVTYGGTEVRTVVHVTTGDATMPVPDRLEGSDRYAVSVEVSERGYPEGADVVYVASGQVFADGLTAGPAAAHQGGPVLLTRGTQMPANVAAEIERLNPSRIVIVGGEATISPAVEAALEGMAATVDRVGGANRYEVSRNLADYAFDGSGAAFIATGRVFSDALSAGPAAASIDAPILLVDGLATGLDGATDTALDALGATSVYLMGGTASMSNGIELDLDNAGLAVSRFAGSDRYQAAILVNRAFFDAPVPAMYIASGLVFPDALSASALAGAQGAPLYLARQACVDSGLITESLRLDQPPVTLVGGPATLAPSVAEYAICG